LSIRATIRKASVRKGKETKLLKHSKTYRPNTDLIL